MTQEEQVLIRGKCFLYRQKAPFVPSGVSVYGALEYNESRDEVRCHECGEWFRLLGTHVWRAHGLDCAEYRQKHGLRSRCALCGPRLAMERTSGNEQYYERLRAMTRSPEGRAAFAALSRSTADRRRSRRTDFAELQNETGHCRAQLTERIKQLAAQYGRTPSRAELIQHGISPKSACLAFNLPNMTEVVKFLEMVPYLGEGGYTAETLIEILRDFYAQYGGHPNRTHERMGLVPRFSVFKRVFGSMASAYKAAGFTVKGRAPYSREMLIDRLQAFYGKYGKVPRPSRKYGRGHGDSLPPGLPSRRVFERMFGSMAAAYEAAGLSASASGRGAFAKSGGS